jgi:ribonuclease HI
LTEEDRKQLQAAIAAAQGHVVIYTDASVMLDRDAAGWGAHFIAGDQTFDASGPLDSRDRNEAEILAAVQALGLVEGRVRVLLFSDSQNLTTGARFELEGWARNCWRNRKGVPIVFRDAWAKLQGELTRHVVTIRKVQGHSKSVGNKIADRLARSATLKQVEAAKA